MTLPFPIAAGQVDAKSPVDDNLMESIKANLDYLDQITTQGGAPVYAWTVNGHLAGLPGRIAKRIDMQFLHVSQLFSRVRIAQGISGDDGVTEIDIRYHSNPKTPITAITPQFAQATTTVAQITPNLATQSISLATDPVSTQTITRAKSTLNVQSIISLGANLWRYNLDAAPDADWLAGDSVLFAGCSNAANDGTFTLVEVNQSGYPSVVVENASGVAQNIAAGTADLQCFSYDLTNPADDHFVAGEDVVLTVHTSGFNNGTKTIYKTNEGGNNIWVKNPTGVTQGSAVGTVTTSRWAYNYALEVGSDFVVGETVQFTAHTSAANNVDAEIKALNDGGNNIIISNASGVAQGSSVGLANTKRWKYTFAANPSADVSVGDSLVMASHTSSANDGTFEVVQVNNLTTDNVVVHNPSGVAQASAAGTVTHVRKLVKFSSDQSLIYSTLSYIEMEGCPDDTYNMVPEVLPFKVLEVNRGGGANYNVVIESEEGSTQDAPAGYVAIEAKSIFVEEDGDKPQVSADLLGLSPNGLLKAVYESDAFISDPVSAQTYLGLYILQIQEGLPKDLSVMLT